MLLADKTTSKGSRKRNGRTRSHVPGPVHEPLSRVAMYQAVVDKDAACIGMFFVGVKTTGVFCRPGCPARTPLEKHCDFFPSAKEAMLAGYRPCKRCKPLEMQSAAPIWAGRLMEQLQNEPECVLTADDARRAGVHPSTAARFFKQHFGATFQALSRARRVGLALSCLKASQNKGDNGHMIVKAMEAGGFTSESGFRKAVEDLFGTTPADAARTNVKPLVARWIETQVVGPMIAVADDEGLCVLEFVDRRMLSTNLVRVRNRLKRPIVPGDHPLLSQIEQELSEYFARKRREFMLPVKLAGTPFQESVWRALMDIPCGETRSYADVARAIGRPTACRAVARANGDNRLAIIVPCHRVIGSNGELVGYGGGLWRKERLINIESGKD